MPIRVLAVAVAGIVEQRGGGCRSGKRPVIADIRPYSAGQGFALGQNRHRGVVPVQPGSAQHMAADQLDERSQRRRAGADPIGHRRDVELYALAGKAFALAIERLMMAVFGIEDHRQQAGAGTPARDGVKGCRRLGDLLAAAAGELLAHGLHDFPSPRHHLQRLGHVLAKFGELAAAARAGGRRRDHHAFAWQVLGKRCPHRLLAGEAAHDGVVLARLGGGGECVFGRACLQLLELQLELIEQLAAALGRWPEALASQFGDDQLQMRDHGLGTRGAGFGLLAGRALGDQRRFECVDPVGENVGCNRHERNSTIIARHCDDLAHWVSQLVAPYPTASGRQVCCGLRQSIPSSM